MNNQQLIRFLGDHPEHSIQRIQPSAAFNRWLTLTAQEMNIEGIPFYTIRQILLDQLYEDWERFRAQTIERNL